MNLAWLRKKSFGYKLRLAMVLLAASAVLIVTASFLAANIIQQRSFAYEKRSDQLAAVVSLLATHIAAPLAFEDLDTANVRLSALRQLTQPKGELDAIVLDPNQQIFTRFSSGDAHERPLWNGPSASCGGKDQNHIVICSAITRDGHHLGELRVRYAMEHDLNALVSRLYQTLITAVAIGIGTIAIAYLLAERLKLIVLKPIIELRRAMTRLPDAGNELLPVTKPAEDELGELVDVFNDMRRRLREHDIELERYHNHLQDEVEQRTAELQTATRNRVMWLENLGKILKHELSKHMVPIGTSLTLIERKRNSNELPKYVDRARKSLTTVETLLETLASASTDEIGIYKLTPTRLCASEMILQWTSHFADAHPNLSLSVQCAPNVMVLSDPAMLGQVLANLVSNAVDHHDTGTDIVIALNKDATHAEVMVANHGVRLPDDLERLFEPFVSMRNAALKREGNIGFGLGFVRLMAFAHNGSAFARTPNDHPGAEFVFRIPLA